MQIYQRPNAPAIIAFISLVVSVLTLGIFQISSSIVFILAATIWSYEEMFHGINWVRKGFGVLGFIVVIIYLYRLFP